MTYVSDVEATFDLAIRGGAEVLGTDADGLPLRILSHKDAAAVMALVQASREHLTPHGDYTDLVDRDLAAHGAALEQADEEPFGVFLKDELVGIVSLIHYGNGVFGLGYWIGAAYRGRGLMTEAIAAVIRFARDSRNAVAIWAGIKPVNSASCHLVDRLGFRLAREQDTHLSYCLDVATWRE
jgi:RimJ/RimL family protein N-acetyltransferase